MKVKITSPTHAPARFYGRRGQLGLSGLSDYTGITIIMDWCKVARSIQFWRKASGTITLSVGDPCVITKVGHGLSAGDIIRVSVSSGGTFPTGFPTSGRLYVLATNLTSDSFTVSTTDGGTAVATTDAGSGTFSIPHITGMDAFDTGYHDLTTGDIAVPARSDCTGYQFYWFTPTTGPSYAGEVWEYYFDGGDGGSVNLTKFDASENWIVKAPGFWEHTWNGGSSRTFSVTITDWNNPPRNFRIYQKRYKNDTIIRGKLYPGYSNGGKFVPEWLAQISEFNVIRFMDFMATNNSPVQEFDQISTPSWYRWIGHPGGDIGPKGIFPIANIAEIATLTGADIHVNIPHLASDSCVQSIAEVLRDNISTNQKVYFEYSNEIWNTIFSQTGWVQTPGIAKYNTPGDPYGDGLRWAGYRAAQCQKIIYDVYGGASGTSRWRGVIPSFTLGTNVTTKKIQGFQDWKTETGSSLNLTDLFHEVSITGYFGDIPGGVGITSISLEPNALVTGGSSSLPAVGKKLIFSFYNGADYQDGMNELNAQVATVTSIVSSNSTVTSFTIDVDTSAYTPLRAADRRNSYYADATEWLMMDESIVKHNADPTTYPSQYSYYREQIAKSFITGYSDYGYKTGQNLTYFRKSDGPWTAQKAVCDQYGLDLTQYESGCHHVGSTYVTGWHGEQVPINGDPDQGWSFPTTNIKNGGNYTGARFTEWNLSQSHAEPISEVYYEGMRRFTELGGKRPSKFVEGGAVSRYGSWGAVRWAKRGTSEGDYYNPVWKAVVAYNRVDFKRAIRRDVSPHRYWRIYVYDTTGVSGSDLGIELKTVQFHHNWQNQVGSGTATASSTFTGSSADNAFDTSNSTGWSSVFTDTWPQWLAYDFGDGEDKSIDMVGIAPSTNTRAPAAFDVQHSDDGTTWTTEWSVTGLTSADWSNGSLRMFEKPNPQY